MSKNDCFSDPTWITALRQGNIQAFNELFDRYGKRLYHFSIGYLKSAQDAEEIVQEVFLKIWKTREELLVEKSFESYLFTIAKNAILNTIRKSKSEQVYLTYAKIYTGKNVLLDEELNFRELEKAYRLVIEQLSPHRKKIYVLSKEQALSNAEIAQMMNISVKTVENQLAIALQKIGSAVSFDIKKTSSSPIGHHR